MNLIRCFAFVLLTFLIDCSPPSVLTITNNFYSFGRPSSDWYVEIPTAKYTVFGHETFNGGVSGTAFIKEAEHPRTYIIFSIEPSNKVLNAVASRNYNFLQLVQNLSTEMSRVYEKDSIAYYETEYNDFGVYGHLLSSSFCKDDAVLTISIYTSHYTKDQDHHIFFDLIKSIRVKSRQIS